MILPIIGGVKKFLGLHPSLLNANGYTSGHGFYIQVYNTGERAEYYSTKSFPEEEKRNMTNGEERTLPLRSFIIFYLFLPFLCAIPFLFVYLYTDMLTLTKLIGSAVFLSAAISIVAVFCAVYFCMNKKERQYHATEHKICALLEAHQGMPKDIRAAISKAPKLLHQCGSFCIVTGLESLLMLGAIPWLKDTGHDSLLTIALVLGIGGLLSLPSRCLLEYPFKKILSHPKIRRALVRICNVSELCAGTLMILPLIAECGALREPSPEIMEEGIHLLSDIANSSNNCRLQT